MLTSFAFVGLLFVLTVIGGVILYFAGRVRHGDSWWYLGDRGYCILFGVAVAITSVIAYFYFGTTVPPYHPTAPTAMTAEKVTPTAATVAEKTVRNLDPSELAFWGIWVLQMLVYFVIAVGITYGIAWYNNGNARSYLHDNNWPLYFGLGSFAVTAFISLFYWGPAKLLPSGLWGVIKGIGTFLHNLWTDEVVPKKIISPPHKLFPWAVGTWYFWWSSLVILLGTVLYTPFGLHDELSKFCQGVGRIIEEHKARPRPSATPGPGGGTPGGTAATTPGARVGFWEIFSIGLLGDVFAEFARHFFKKGTTP